VAEGGGNDVLHRQVEVCARGDDDRIFPAGLPDQRQVGAERTEQRSRLEGPGEHQAVYERVGYQAAAQVVLVDVHECQRIGWYSGVPKCLDHHGAGPASLGRRFYYDARAGRERTERRAGRDRDREVPRRCDHGELDGDVLGAVNLVEFFGQVA